MNLERLLVEGLQVLGLIAAIALVIVSLPAQAALL